VATPASPSFFLSPLVAGKGAAAAAAVGRPLGGAAGAGALASPGGEGGRGGAARGVGGGGGGGGALAFGAMSPPSLRLFHSAHEAGGMGDERL
jgi:hypothetical protein